MYEVDREASADIPGLASSHDPTFEEWRSFAIERPSRDLDLTLLALADGEWSASPTWRRRASTT